MLTLPLSSLKLIAALSILAAIAGAYFMGSHKGYAKCQAEQLQADLKQATETVSEIVKINEGYEPIYQEIRSSNEKPACPAPAVIKSTIKRLQSQTANKR